MGETVYVCTRCGYVFSRHAVPRLCPSCERDMIRRASEAEASAFAQSEQQRTAAGKSEKSVKQKDVADT